MIKPDTVYIVSRTKKTKYLYEKNKSNKNSHPTNAVIEKIRMEKGMINKIKRVGGHASYLKIPPELPGWLIVTLETIPVAERIQTDRGPL